MAVSLAKENMADMGIEIIINGESTYAIESMHLEIREKGFRDTEANAVKTAKIIATALSQLAE